jgi:hypothetical protein
MPLSRVLLSAIVLLLDASCAARAVTLEVGPGREFAQPSAAAAVARDGDRLRANNLLVEGAGPQATVITDKTCGGKALFITQGNNITIRNLTLTRARVSDANGAGIRAEGGNLAVDHVRFLDNQEGILAAPNPAATLLVRDSEFIRNGTCEGGGGCAHGIYVNDLALLRIERSRFFETMHGHHIKSRARQTEVIGCDIADGDKGTASYAIDVSNGGGVLLRDSRIEKGPNAENRTGALVIGAEGVSQPTPEIVVEHNTFRVDGAYTSYLVVNVTATPARLTGNTMIGNARPLKGDGTVD